MMEIKVRPEEKARVHFKSSTNSMSAICTLSIENEIYMKWVLRKTVQRVFVKGLVLCFQAHVCVMMSQQNVHELTYFVS